MDKGKIRCDFLSAIVIALLASANSLFAERIATLGERPNWSSLNAFQDTITKEDFTRELTRVYAPNHSYRHYITILADSALIRTSLASKEIFKLRFSTLETAAKPVPRYWRPASEMPEPPLSKPLEGVKIALDPGHIGGKWAKMEERWFQIGSRIPVLEGDMTLLVARKLKRKLEAMGAKVSMIRDDTKPVTKTRPANLRKEALEELRKRGVKKIRKSYSGETDPFKTTSIQWQSELLFYRISEIRERGKIVNEEVKPDLVVALHFNAESWGDPANPTLVDENHLHLIVNGTYSQGELSYDDVRFEMLLKLLGQTAPEAIAMSDAVAVSMRKSMNLPPYIYTGRNATRVGETGYVWSRNLLANRIYRCPVIYLEPYVMNSREVFERIELGDYEGTREVNGKVRKSIFEEYAESVSQGLGRYFLDARRN